MALEIDPNYMQRAWINKSVTLSVLEILLKSGKLDEAIKCYERYLDISPNRKQVLYSKAWALAKSGKLDEAIKCYERYWELYGSYFELSRYTVQRPNSVNKQVLYDKAWALAKSGKLDEAIKCYERYIGYHIYNYCTRFPTTGTIVDGFNDVFDPLPPLGKVEEDIKCYISQKLDPNHKDTWYVKGLVCLGLGEYNEAIMYYDKVLEIDPNYIQVWKNKAYALRDLGRNREANECFDKALLLSSHPTFMDYLRL